MCKCSESSEALGAYFRCKGIRGGVVGGKRLLSSMLKTRKDLDIQKGSNEEAILLVMAWTKCF